MLNRAHVTHLHEFVDKALLVFGRSLFFQGFDVRGAVAELCCHSDGRLGIRGMAEQDYLNCCFQSILLKKINVIMIDCLLFLVNFREAQYTVSICAHHYGKITAL